ncbi:MAG: hypothetical protein HEQ40_04785 [Lacibacter sp.]|jgi:hypothetical protein
MTYKLTPLNLFCCLLLGVELLFFLFPEILADETYGYQHVYLIPVILIGFVIDYFFQRLIKRYLWIFLAEVLLIIILIWGNKA